MIMYVMCTLSDCRHLCIICLNQVVCLLVVFLEYIVLRFASCEYDVFFKVFWSLSKSRVSDQSGFRIIVAMIVVLLSTFASCSK